MKNKVLIKISGNSYLISKYLINKNIDFNIIDNNINHVTVLLDKSNLSKIYYFKYEIIKDYSFKNIICFIKKRIYYIFLLCLAIILFSLLSNIIVQVKISSSNNELVNKLKKTLDYYDIKRLTFKKNYQELKDIKDKILDEYKDNIEWLEIENVGLNYNIKLEERKIINSKKEEGICDIVSIRDGIISKIISSKGIILHQVNTLVKEGDILISGNIKLNDEIKKSVCANGSVYASIWYKVILDIPLIYQEKVYTNTTRNNLIIDFDNRDFKIFKSRLENFDEDKEEVISLFNKKIYLVKEVEYVLETKEYSEDALNKRIDEIVSEKLSLNLNAKERIIDKKVLKKEVNNSRIKIELFTRVEKMIGKQITY